MRVAVTGASGMLGTCLIKKLSNKYQVSATARKLGFQSHNIEWNCFDLTNTVDLSSWLSRTSPDAIVHCAANVNVELCEHDQIQANNIHVHATEQISNYAILNATRLIYVSTDSVFNGKSSVPYNESDMVEPLNHYAQSKYIGERSVLKCSSGLVLRTNIIGWGMNNQKTFFEWLLGALVSAEPIKLFDDVYFSPITVDHFSNIISHLLQTRDVGLFHCGSSDKVSKYQFGLMVSKVFDCSFENVFRISIDDAHLTAKRPKNMSLDSSNLSMALGKSMPTVAEAILLLKTQFDQTEMIRASVKA